MNSLLNKLALILSMFVFTITISLMGFSNSSLAAEKQQESNVAPVAGELSDNPAPDQVVASETNHVGRSQVAPPKQDDSHFVADTGGLLDQYLFREQGRNGKLWFTIAIDRYFSTLIKADPVTGRLDRSVARDLVQKRILPATAKVTLQVWDVDHNEATVCPEVDHVIVNGQTVMNATGTGPLMLTSGNEAWSTFSFQVPIDYLKFPTAKGLNGNRPVPAVQEIEIDINVKAKNGDPNDKTGCNYNPGLPGKSRWAVEVDWASIHIPNAVHPIIFAHGWTGDVHTFDNFERLAKADGIPSAGQPDLLRGIKPIEETAQVLKKEINRTLQEFGVDKVNIFAHSKGGLVARYYLHDPAEQTKVEHLITFSTPHRGIPWGMKGPLKTIAGIPWFGNCNRLPSDCTSAVDEFTEDGIIGLAGFNYKNCTKTRDGFLLWGPQWKDCQPEYVKVASVIYKSLVAEITDVGVQSATFPWEEPPTPTNNGNPWPALGKADKVYGLLLPFGHQEIKQNQRVYGCAITFLNLSISARSDCSTLQEVSSAQAAEDSPFLPEDDYQIALSRENVMSQSEIDTATVKIDGNMAVFNVFSTVPVTFTLLDPAGRMIDPVIASSDMTITFTKVSNPEINSWWYQYVVDNPIPGSWLNSAETASAGAVAFIDMVKSDVKLGIRTDREQYQPGETVTVNAGLVDVNSVEAAGANNTTVLHSVELSGTVLQPDGTKIDLTFFDDGTHGDTTPNDGIYTTQFSASNTSGRPSITLYAKNDIVSRMLEHNIAVAAQTAQIGQIVNETVIDTNGNGLYDVLQLNLQVNVITSGQFEVSGTLVDKDGHRITSAFYSTLSSTTEQFDPGTHIVGLAFDGKALRQFQTDGPYTLTDVSILDYTIQSLKVDSKSDVYVTQPYAFEAFEKELLELREGQDQVLDIDNNGKYDQLAIKVFLNVVNPGDYSWNGRLMDMQGGEIGWFVGNGFLDSQTPMIFTFNGKDIGRNGQNGPYVLSDVSVFQANGGNATAVFENAYTTGDYRADQFDDYLAPPAPTIPGITIKKLTNGIDSPEIPGLFLTVGSQITWTYVVTNTGNITLTNVTVTNEQGIVVVCPQDVLVVGEAMTCTGTGMATSGQQSSLGMANAVSLINENISVAYISYYFGMLPEIKIKTLINGVDTESSISLTLAVTDPITWTYIVTNTGNITLTNVLVTDDHPEMINCPQSVLAPNGSMVCISKGVAAPGDHKNIGRVVGSTPSMDTVTADDFSFYSTQPKALDEGQEPEPPRQIFLPLIQSN